MNIRITYLLITIISAYSEDLGQKDLIPNPIMSNTYGVFHVTQIIRTKGAGKFPISYNSFDVLEIDGRKLDKVFSILVDFEGGDPQRNDTIVTAGFETITAIGVPANIPEGFGIEPRQSRFHFRNTYKVVAVKNCNREKGGNAQQGDAPEPATNAVPASPTSIPPAR